MKTERNFSLLTVCFSILIFVVIFSQSNTHKSELTSKYIHDTAKIRKFLLQKIPGFNISHGYVPKKGLKIPDIYINRQDTSCPLAQNEKGRIDKMPNLIAVGFAKCGTGSLSFLDCHSQIVFRFVEPSFFGNAGKLRHDKFIGKNVLDAYNLPKAHESEILVEKTPGYMNGEASNLRNRFQLMKAFSPGVKILVLLCDPMHRLWSHLKMNKKNNFYLHMANLTQTWLPAMQNFDYKSGKNINDLQIFKQGTAVAQGVKFGYAKKLLLMGFYYSRLKVLIETFGRERVLLLDGDNLISDPDTEFGKVEEFVGVRKELSFEFATRYPYPCLDEPVPMCLPDTKGTTHGSTKQPNSPELLNFYKKEMQMLKSLLQTFPNYDKDSKRFLWLDKYDD